MKPIANWREVLAHAWSVRFIAASILLSALELAVPLLRDLLPVQPGTFAVFTVLTSVAAGVARFVAQRRLQPETDPRWETGDEA